MTRTHDDTAPAARGPRIAPLGTRAEVWGGPNRGREFGHHSAEKKSRRLGNNNTETVTAGSPESDARDVASRGGPAGAPSSRVPDDVPDAGWPGDARAPDGTAARDDGGPGPPSASVVFARASLGRAGAELGRRYPGRRSPAGKSRAPTPTTAPASGRADRRRAPAVAQSDAASPPPRRSGGFQPSKRDAQQFRGGRRVRDPATRLRCFEQRRETRCEEFCRYG